MAQYITTGEELTSVANAIRAASGENSPLIYPTGFVNKINELSKYSWQGKNAELVWQSNDITLTFADTSISSWTPSTSATTIYTQQVCTPETLQLDHDNQYIIIYECYTNCEYNETPANAYIDENYFVGFYCFGARPNTVNNFLNNINDWVTYVVSAGVLYQIYYSPSHTLSVTNNTYGIYFNTAAPILSNQNKSTIGCQLQTPQIRAVVGSSYMHADSFSALNLNNSNIHMKVKLYSTEDTAMSSLHRRIKELYNINHNIT